MGAVDEYARMIGEHFHSALDSGCDQAGDDFFRVQAESPTAQALDDGKGERAIAGLVLPGQRNYDVFEGGFGKLDAYSGVRPLVIDGLESVAEFNFVSEEEDLRADAFGFATQNLFDFGWLGRRNGGDASLEDSGFFASDGAERVAEDIGVIDADLGDG